MTTPRPVSTPPGAAGQDRATPGGDAGFWQTLPSRGALNPILSDEPIIDTDDQSAAVFYTPSAQRLAANIEVIIAIVAGVFLATAWTLSKLGGPEPLVRLFTLFAFAVAGLPALEAVWEKIQKFRIDIDLLMLLGAGLAAYIGSPFEGALLLFLFALSGGLESFALRRTQRAIVALRHLAPKEALVLDGDRAVRTPLRQVLVGAAILVRPGDKIPLDGEIVAGSSSINEAAITGESVPVDRAVGDTVLAGTQNLNGRLEVRVTKHAADTTLARIVDLVTKARHNPAKTQRLVDRIGPPYSITVIVVSIAVGFFGWLVGVEGSEAVRRAIAVLIAASPCALIIATPVAYLAAIAAAARNGVLIKGGAHLEAVAQAVAVVFDKTGTLTSGQIRLTDVDSPAGLDETETLRLAGAIEAPSSHPLAGAVNRAVESRGLAIPEVQDYENLPGEGARARINGQNVWLGRPEQAGKYGASSGEGDVAGRTQRMRSEGKTVSAVVANGSVALLGFQDTVRDDTRECLTRLREQGIRHLEMLTGDHEQVARKISADLGLDAFQAELSPEDKLTAVEQLRKSLGRVVLVGDGINDAPALTQADVGIAMGGTGADVAMEAADIVLMKNRISAVAWLHRHALRTTRIVRQNVAFALVVIVVLSFFAAVGRIPLPLAVVGHEGSTVLVALNALRLLRRI